MVTAFDKGRKRLVVFNDVLGRLPLAKDPSRFRKRFTQAALEGWGFLRVSRGVGVEVSVASLVVVLSLLKRANPALFSSRSRVPYYSAAALGGPESVFAIRSILRL